MRSAPTAYLSQGTVEFPLRAHWELNQAKLPGWERLLPAWIRIHAAYTDAFVPQDGELSLYYRERPQIGFLAAAAFAAGGVALEEWGTEKNEGYGRNDLWVRLCPQTEAEDYTIEAKHGWIDFPLCDAPGCFNKIQQIHDQARNSADRLRPGRNVAVGFSSLTCKVRDESVPKRLAEDWWKPLFAPQAFNGSIAPDGIAILWLGPASAHSFLKRSGEIKDECATVALVITVSLVLPLDPAR